MDFNALLQEAQKLTSETNAPDFLPRVERSLPQLLQATRELHSRVTQTEAQDIQAYVFTFTECSRFCSLEHRLKDMQLQLQSHSARIKGNRIAKNLTEA